MNCVRSNCLLAKTILVSGLPAPWTVSESGRGRMTHWNKGLTTSLRGDWETPQELYDELDKEFHFTLDVCANHKNFKCVPYYHENSLEKVWKGVCWMNPPYGREIGKWIKKAYEEATIGGATVVCLLPSRTDTAWWHDYCMKGEVRFIRGRLKFDGQKNSAPFPSAIVVFKPNQILQGEGRG